MKQRSFALKGDLCWSRDARHLNTMKDGWLVCVDGRSAGVFETLPEEYANLPVEDWSGHLVIPGLVDLHVHAPQYTSGAWAWTWSCWTGWTGTPSPRSPGTPTWTTPARPIPALWRT